MSRQTSPLTVSERAERRYLTRNTLTRNTLEKCSRLTAQKCVC